MSIDVTAGFNVLVVEPVDSREKSPTLAAAKQLAANRRYQGLKIFIEDEAKLYWFKDGITDDDLVEFIVGGIIPTPVAPDADAEQGDYADAKDTYDALQDKADKGDIPDISGKVDKDQGVEAAGKVLTVDETGMVVPSDSMLPEPVAPTPDAEAGDYADAYQTYLELNAKLPKYQGDENEGKYLTVGAEGLVVTTDLPEPPDISTKVDKDQGSANSGMVLGIGNDGLVVPVTVTDGGTIPDPINPDPDAAYGTYADARFTFEALEGKAWASDLPKKVDKDQGVAQSGKYLTVGADGKVTCSDAPPIPDPPDISGKVDKQQGVDYKGQSLIVGDDGMVALEARANIDLSNLSNAKGEKHFDSRYEKTLQNTDGTIEIDREVDGITLIRAVIPDFTGANKDLSNLSDDGKNRFDKVAQGDGIKITKDPITLVKTISATGTPGPVGDWADVDLSNLSVDKGEKKFQWPLEAGMNIALGTGNPVRIAAANANWKATIGNAGYIENKPTIPDTDAFADKNLENLTTTGETHFQKPLKQGHNITISATADANKKYEISAADGNWLAAEGEPGYISGKPTIPPVDGMANIDLSNLSVDKGETHFQQHIIAGANIAIGTDKRTISATMPDVSNLAWCDLGNLDAGGEAHFDGRYSAPLHMGSGISITNHEGGGLDIATTFGQTLPGWGLKWNPTTPNAIDIIPDEKTIEIKNNALSIKGNVCVGFANLSNDDDQTIGWKAYGWDPDSENLQLLFTHTDAGTSGPSPIGVYVSTIQGGHGDIVLKAENDTAEDMANIIKRIEYDEDDNTITFYTDGFTTGWIRRTVSDIYDAIPSDLRIAIIAGAEALIAAAGAAATAVATANSHSDAALLPVATAVAALEAQVAPMATQIPALQAQQNLDTNKINQFDMAMVLSDHGTPPEPFRQYAMNPLTRKPLITSASGMLIDLTNRNRASFAQAVSEVFDFDRGLVMLANKVSVNIDNKTLVFDNNGQIMASAGQDFNSRGISTIGGDGTVLNITLFAWFNNPSWAHHNLITLQYLEKRFQEFDWLLNERYVDIFTGSQHSTTTFREFFEYDGFALEGLVSTSYFMQVLSGAGGLGFDNNQRYYVRLNENSLLLDETTNLIGLRWDFDDRRVTWYDREAHIFRVTQLSYFLEDDLFADEFLVTESFLKAFYPRAGAGLIEDRDPETEVSYMHVNSGRGLHFYNDFLEPWLGDGLWFDDAHIGVLVDNSLCFRGPNVIPKVPKMLGVAHNPERSGLIIENDGLRVNHGRGLTVDEEDADHCLELFVNSSLWFTRSGMLAVKRKPEGGIYHIPPSAGGDPEDCGIGVNVDNITIDCVEGKVSSVCAYRVWVACDDKQTMVQPLMNFIQPESGVMKNVLITAEKAQEIFEPVFTPDAPLTRYQDGQGRNHIGLTVTAGLFISGDFLAVDVSHGLAFDNRIVDGVYHQYLTINPANGADRGLMFDSDDKLNVRRNPSGAIGSGTSGIGVKVDNITLTIVANELCIRGNYTAQFVKTDLSNLNVMNSMQVSPSGVGVKIHALNGLGIDADGMFVAIAASDLATLGFNPNGQLVVRRSTAGAITTMSGGDAEGAHGGIGVRVDGATIIINQYNDLQVVDGLYIMHDLRNLQYLSSLDVTELGELGVVVDSASCLDVGVNGMRVNLSSVATRTLTVNDRRQLTVKRARLGALVPMGTTEENAGLGVQVDGTTVRINALNQLEVTAQGGGGYHAGFGLQLLNDTFSVDINSASGLYFNGNSLAIKVTDGMLIDGQGYIGAKVDGTTVKFNQQGELTVGTTQLDAGDGIAIQNFVVSVNTVPQGFFFTPQHQLSLLVTYGLAFNQADNSLVLHADPDHFKFKADGSLQLQRFFTPGNGIFFSVDEIGSGEMAINVLVDNYTLFIDQHDQTVDDHPLAVRFDPNSGLTCDNSNAFLGLQVKLGTGLAFDESGGIKTTGGGYTGGAAIAISAQNVISLNGSSNDFTVNNQNMLLFRAGQGLARSANGVIVKLVNPLEFDANNNISLKIDDQSMVLADFGVGVKLLPDISMLKKTDGGMGVNYDTQYFRPKPNEDASEYRLSFSSTWVANGRCITWYRDGAGVPQYPMLEFDSDYFYDVKNGASCLTIKDGVLLDSEHIFVAAGTQNTQLIRTLKDCVQVDGSDLQKLLVSHSELLSAYYTGKGLETFTDASRRGYGFRIKIDKGLEFGSGANPPIQVRLAGDKGIGFDAAGVIEIKLGQGLAFGQGGVIDATGGVVEEYFAGDGIEFIDGEEDHETIIKINYDSRFFAIATAQERKGALTPKLGKGLAMYNDGQGETGFGVKLGDGLVFDDDGGIAATGGGGGGDYTAGDGINILNDTEIVVDLTDKSGLEFSGGKLQLKVGAGLSIATGTLGMLFDVTTLQTVNVPNRGSVLSVYYNNDAGLTAGDDGIAVRIGTGLQFVDGIITVPLAPSGGIGVGDNGLYVRFNTSQGLAWTQAGICVNIGDGLTFGEGGRIDVVGGGGGDYVAGDGIDISDTHAISVKCADDGGLEVETSDQLNLGLKVKLGDGLIIDPDGLIIPKLGKGMWLNNFDQIEPRIGDGLRFGVRYDNEDNPYTTLDIATADRSLIHFIQENGESRLDLHLQANWAWDWSDNGLKINFGDGVRLVSGALEIDYFTAGQAIELATTNKPYQYRVNVLHDTTLSVENGNLLHVHYDTDSGLTQIEGKGLAVKRGPGIIFDDDGFLIPCLGKGMEIADQGEGIQPKLGNGLFFDTKYDDQDKPYTTLDVALHSRRTIRLVEQDGIQKLDVFLAENSGWFVDGYGIKLKTAGGLNMMNDAFYCNAYNFGDGLLQTKQNNPDYTYRIDVAFDTTLQLVQNRLHVFYNRDFGLEEIFDQGVYKGIGVRLDTTTGLAFDEDGLIYLALGAGFHLNEEGELEPILGPGLKFTLHTETGDPYYSMDVGLAQRGLIVFQGDDKVLDLNVSDENGWTWGGNDGLKLNLQGGLSIQNKKLTCNGYTAGAGIEFVQDQVLNYVFGINIKHDSSLFTAGNPSLLGVNVNAARGLTVSNFGVEIVIGAGLKFQNGALEATEQIPQVDASRGIGYGNEGVYAKLGNGLKFSDNGLIEVTGGGGGCNCNGGVCIDVADDTISLLVNYDSGLNVDDTNHLAVLLDPAGGLESRTITNPAGGADLNALAIRAGAGLISSAQDGLELAINSNNLAIVQDANGFKILSVWSDADRGLAAVDDTGLHVKIGDGMMFDANGAVVPMIGQGLHFVEHTPDGEDPFNTFDVSLGGGLSFDDDDAIGVNLAPAGCLGFNQQNQLSVRLDTTAGLMRNSVGEVSAIGVRLGDGLQFMAEDFDHAIGLRILEASGLRLVGNKGSATLQVYAGSGLAIHSKGPLNVVADSNKGIGVNDTGVFAKLGAGLTFDGQGQIASTGGEDYTGGDGIAVDDHVISTDINASSGLGYDNQQRLAVLLDPYGGLQRTEVENPSGEGTVFALSAKLGNRLEFDASGAIAVSGAADYEGAGCIDVNEETRQIALRYDAGTSLYLERKMPTIPLLALQLHPHGGLDHVDMLDEDWPHTGVALQVNPAEFVINQDNQLELAHSYTSATEVREMINTAMAHLVQLNPSLNWDQNW